MKQRMLVVLGLMVGCSAAAGEEEPGAAKPAQSPAPNVDASDAPDASATAEGGTKKPGPPPLTGKPTDEQLTEKYGVFVSTKGSADGSGTREKPLSSIRDAIARAKEDSRRVYVCEGTYLESLILESGISVVGGFDCTSFTWRLGSGKSRLEAPTSPAVRASGIAAATRFDGFDVVAPDGSEASPSSIGLIADQSPALTVVSSKFTSGKGLSGADGVEGVQLLQGGTPAANGFGGDGPRRLDPGRAGTAGGLLPVPPEHPVKEPAAAGGTSVCQGAPGHDGEAGGAGDVGGSFTCKRASASSWKYAPMATIPLFYGGSASGLENPAVAAQIRSGAPGAPGAGTGGQQGGTLTPAGYITADGIPGGDGSIGHGGSGGSRHLSRPADGLACSEAEAGFGWTAASGGGGGAGGCPGLAGTPGKGGGASIGVLVIASDGLAISDTEIIAGTAGDGGKGTLGSEPTPGGAPGNGGNGYANAGSSGGAGGRAGLSGHGGGGPSYGLAFTGGSPKLTATAPKAGTGGAGRPAESKTMLGTVVSLPASKAGAAEDVHSF